MCERAQTPNKLSSPSPSTAARNRTRTRLNSVYATRSRFPSVCVSARREYDGGDDFVFLRTRICGSHMRHTNTNACIRTNKTRARARVALYCSKRARACGTLTTTQIKQSNISHVWRLTTNKGFLASCDNYKCDNYLSLFLGVMLEVCVQLICRVVCAMSAERALRRFRKDDICAMY